jgi:class 3 adenylate cyclase
LHTGEVLRDQDKFFGKTVILASRIAAQARGGEIVVSSMIRELLGSAREFAFADAIEVALKGIAGPQRIHHVAW